MTGQVDPRQTRLLQAPYADAMLKTLLFWSLPDLEKNWL